MRRDYIRISHKKCALASTPRAYLFSNFGKPASFLPAELICLQMREIDGLHKNLDGQKTCHHQKACLCKENYALFET